MPTLRSNAITQNGVTMDFFSLVGIKLAEPSVQTNQGRLESDLVETTQARLDSQEGIWGNAKSDPTSQQKQSDRLTRVYLSFDGNDDDPSSTWADVREDEFGDACVDVKIRQLSSPRIFFSPAMGGCCRSMTHINHWMMKEISSSRLM